MKNINIPTTVSGLFLFAFLYSCIGVKPGSEPGGKKLYETFYAGEQGSQYFIKPLVLKNASKEKLTIDFSFRYKTIVKDSAIVNVSFINRDLIKKIDSCTLSTGKIKFNLDNMNFLFLEREGKNYNLRYSSKAALADIQKLFGQNDWTLTAYRQNIKTEYLPEPSTLKKITKIHHYIFSLF